ncbi:MAG: hypothetical protein ACKOW9_05000 [Candidatus Paceibacterota bacterium]
MGNPKLTAVPSARSRLPVLQIRLALILGTLLFASLMGVVSTVAWISNKPAPVDLRGAVAYGKSIAETAAHEWLSGKVISVPMLSNVDLPNSSKPLKFSELAWEGFTRESLPTGLIYERHTFLTTIESSDEIGYKPIKVLVVVAFPRGQDAYLAALPSFSPVTQVPVSKVFDYSDLETENLPSNVDDQIRKWASAYAMDERETLKLLTGDSSDGAEYAGLGEFNVSNVKVLSAIPAGDTGYGSDTWLVRVTMTLVSDYGFKTNSEMDITVTEAGSGLPRIVGWSGAGAGLRGGNDTRIKQ